MIIRPRILAALLVLLLVAPAGAQTTRPAPGVGPRPGVVLEQIQETLRQFNLSDEQTSKIKDVVTKARDEFAQMRSDLESMEPRDRAQRLRDLLEDVHKDVAAILTPEQKATFDKKWEEGRQNLRNRFNAAQREPSTRPAQGRGPGGPGGGPAAFADRVRENLQKLDLSDEQKVKIKDLFDEMKAKGEGLRMQAESGVEEARVKLRELFQESREKLNSILTTEQRDKLRELMAPPGGEPGRPRPGNNRPNSDKPAKPEKADADMMMQDDMMSSSSKSEKKKPDMVQIAPIPAGPSPGDSVPSVTLKKLDGSTIDLSSLKGRVVVLEFGSYSCPAFRNRVAAMEKLKSEYANRAQFYVVFGREAHALGEWEVDRNKDAGISVEQPRSIESRKALAEEARDKLKITVPILMDMMGNDATKSLGAGPNSACVIGRDGKILAHQKWFDPGALRRILDEAVKTSPTTKPAP